MLNFFRPRDRSLSLCDSLLQIQRRREVKLRIQVFHLGHSQDNSDNPKVKCLTIRKEREISEENRIPVIIPVLVVIQIPLVLLFSQHQEGDFINKGIPILFHLPGLLPSIMVCLLPLLILEAFNLCKHLGDLFLQLLQKKYQESEGDWGKSNRCKEHVLFLPSVIGVGQVSLSEPGKDVCETCTALMWPCPSSRDSSWKKKIIMGWRGRGYSHVCCHSGLENQA